MQRLNAKEGRCGKVPQGQKVWPYGKSCVVCHRIASAVSRSASARPSRPVVESARPPCAPALRRWHAPRAKRSGEFIGIERQRQPARLLKARAGGVRASCVLPGGMQAVSSRRCARKQARMRVTPGHVFAERCGVCGLAQRRF